MHGERGHWLGLFKEQEEYAAQQALEEVSTPALLDRPTEGLPRPGLRVVAPPPPDADRG